MAAEAPYKLPASLDIERLASLLEAKMSATEDHVWSLREDPAYFAQQFLEVKDHRQEMMPDTKGNPHPVTHRIRENTLWARVVFGILVDAYANLEAFTELHRQARNLSLLQQRFQKEIQLTKDLPENYLVALLRFKYFPEQTAKGPLDKLKVAVTASPPMRKLFVREPPPDPDTTPILVKSRPRVKMDKVEQNLIWLLRILWEDDYELFLAPLPIVVDESERLLQAEPKADALISAHVIKMIAQQFETASVDHVETFKKEYTALQKPMTQLHGGFMQKRLDNAARLGEPSGGKFTYPYGKRRTKETVDALRRAEANLDIFWAKVDEVTKGRVTDFEETALCRLLSRPRILRRTAEWVEPTPTNNKTEPTLNKDLCPQTSQKLNAHDIQTKPKTKTKTKGDLSTTLPNDNNTALSQTTEPEVADAQPTFYVDARALEVFRTMFFNPEVTSTPGSIPWNDFLHAMVSTGFQIEKLYGSVWQFSPTKLDVERGIHFHEPHPKGKIPFEVARRHGRRMTRTYGWFGGMFVLKEKQ
ncbi:hypothetical protein FSARC_3226 [Fusarium sarcochroum]|uniref:Uncharacterized protein n=1 Tax=Fusarium sarcochroum TaxID=1208366 RepID=A0A8H4XBZ5_9HYPO|nr:hypothetical protein FSARC_3226 [Fusarium sarcochroum]